MALYGSGGQFGGMYQNPQYGSMGGQMPQNAGGLFNQGDQGGRGQASYMPWNPYGARPVSQEQQNQMAQQQWEMQMAQMQGQMGQYGGGGYDQGGGYSGHQNGQQGYGQQGGGGWGTYGDGHFNLQGPNDQTLFDIKRYPNSTHATMGDWGAAFGWGGPGGGWGGGNPEMRQFQGGDYQAPEKWGGGTFDAPQSSFDASQMVERMEPILQRQREQGFAEVGDRFGQSGFAMSTPYAQQLGDVERNLQENLAKEAWGVQAQLDQERANRDLTAQQNEWNRRVGAWGQHGGWEHGGQLAGMGQDMAQWQQQGNWDQANANRDFAGWQQQQQNNMQQQQMMQSLMPMLMGGGMY